MFCRPFYNTDFTSLILPGTLLVLSSLSDVTQSLIFAYTAALLSVIPISYVLQRVFRRKSMLYVWWAKSWLKQLCLQLGNKMSHAILSLSSNRSKCIRSFSNRATGMRFYSPGFKCVRVCWKRRRHKFTGLPISCFTTVKAFTSDQNNGTFGVTNDLAVDNCASKCMTNDLSDFIIPPTKCNRSIKGLGTGHATHHGTVRWTLSDDKGVNHSFQIKDVYYVKSLPFRIWSPQHVSQQLARTSWCTTYQQEIVLYWNEGENYKTIRLTKNSNIGLMSSAAKFKEYAAFLHENPDTITKMTCFPTNVISDDEFSGDEGNDDTLADDITMTDESSQTPGIQETTIPPEQRGPQLIDFLDEELNTSQVQYYPERELQSPQAELLRWHYRFGHCSFEKLRIMSKNGEIPKRLQHCRIPKCPACIYGKMTKKPWQTKTPGSNVKPRTVTAPGHCVSIDQLESPQPGFIAQLKGALTRQRYQAATIFVDHYSRLSYVYVQRSTTAEETIKAKKAFELFATGYGVTVKHYHADNGRFAENNFMAEIAKSGQSISFCGVNAHFQNGIAEKRIRDLQEGARTAILDAKNKWPRAVNVALWPYALRQQNYAHMHTPDRSGKNDGKTPIEIFSGSEVRPNPDVFHPFGCPVYALNSDLATGKKIPKWLPRARLGLYLGFSPMHARNVALVLNTQTGLVSPQYHVKFDDLFETVNYSQHRAIDTGEWQVKAGLKIKKDGKVVSTMNVTTKTKNASNEQQQQQHQHLPQEQLAHPTPQGLQDDDGWVPEGDDQAVMQEQVTPLEASQPPPRRSARQFVPTREYLESLQQEDLAFPIPFEALGQENAWEEEQNLSLHPFCLVGKAGDPDTMYLDQALKEPDRADFINAMQKEVASHEERKHWELSSRSNVPQGTKILPAVWSMKRKRRAATGEVYKHKARLNVHGGKQEHGVNFWETYSPVVNWFTIRLFLILALLYKWHARQVDFVLAFPQADIECEMYMEIPRGFRMPEHQDKRDYCLKLKKNLYGQKQAGRIWNKHLHKGLIATGFKQSQVDECLYYRGTTVFLVYVDDGILIGPDMEDIQSIIKQLRSLNYDITDEGDLKDYLGVDIQRQGTKVHMSQPKLISQILKDLNFMDDTKTSDYPSLISEVLTAHKDKPAHKAHWEYRSIIGKLNYLEKSTRPEIAYATHQAARFSIDPREPHTKAVHRIGRYLAGSRDKGIIMDPSDLNFKVYVDADFSGLWDRKTAEDDPTTAKSRTGFVIMFAGCPIIWMSKLQTEVALSTTEAEYIALSESLRHVIPLMNLFDECNKFGIIETEVKPQIQCTAFEDNSGALELAKAPKMRPRTKHINIKYHHFRSYVTEGRITVEAIDTKDQLADCFTKAVTVPLFLKFRKAIMGW